MTNLEFASGLRELAEIYEKNPDLTQPALGRIWIFTYSKEELQKALKAFGGSAEKNYTDSGLELFPAAKVPVAINIPRDEVCTRKVVGTRTVPSQYFPEHEEDIVEWDCHPILDETAATVEVEE